jgi:hypothetical protein
MVTNIETAIDKLEAALEVIESDAAQARKLVQEAAEGLATALGVKLAAGPDPGNDPPEDPNNRSGGGGGGL